MTKTLPDSALGRWLPWLMLFYLATSLLHFAHNAEYVSSYPNLPVWLTGAVVYVAWLGVTAIGVAGYGLFRTGYQRTGLVLTGVYAALGFDGLLHYARAPLMAHSVAMNLTIWLEVLASALLLASVLAVGARAARCSTS